MTAVEYMAKTFGLTLRYTRFDLTARKGGQRRGASGNWNGTSEILSTDCR